MCVLAHLSAIAAAVLSAGSLSLIGPLIMWFVYKDKSPAIRSAAAGAFNFNLTMWVVYWAAWIAFATFFGIPLAIVLWVFAGVMTLLCHIRGAMAANQGRSYDYPFQLRILS